MKIFDSLKDKKWSGKNIKISNDALVMFKASKANYPIILSEGKHSVLIIGKKRSGNGKFDLRVMSDDGSVFLSEKIVCSKTSWTEFRFEFVVPQDFGTGKIILTRNSGSFGTIEIGRIKIDLNNNIEREERTERIKKSKKKEIVPSLSNLNTHRKNKKMAFIIPYGIYGGAEIYIKNLLDNIDLNSYDIDLLFMNKNKFIHVMSDPRLKKKLCRNIDNLRGTLIANQYDFIIYYNRADIYKVLESLRAESKIDSRTIEIYHSDFEWPGSLSKIKARKNVDLMFTVAPSLANNITGISYDSRMVLPVGIDLRRFNSVHKDDKLRKELLNGRNGVIGTVARISPEKNIEYIMKLASKMKNYSFVIIGDGPLLKPYKNYISDRSINNVKFLGFQRDVHKFYPNFDAFLLPSKMEGTPISILEAMASEVPVFSSRVGAIPDIIEDKKTGFFISGTALKDAKLIENNMDNFEVVNDALKMVKENHDITSNASEFIRRIVDFDNSFVPMDFDSDVIILRGQFI